MSENSGVWLHKFHCITYKHLHIVLHMYDEIEFLTKICSNWNKYYNKYNVSISTKKILQYL
jgi:hypothetical protein